MGKITKKNLIAAAQCRAARGLLGLSQSQLADLANLSKSSIARFEAGGPLTTNNHVALGMALDREGIEFIDPNGGGLGVRFRDPTRRGDEKGLPPPDKDQSGDGLHELKSMERGKLGS